MKDGEQFKILDLSIREMKIMILRRIVQGSVTYFITSLVVHMSFIATSYAGGFHVIPTIKEVVKEVCTGTPVGAPIFKLSVSGSFTTTLYVGGTFATDSGKIVEITGTTRGEFSEWGVYYIPDSSFFVAPGGLSVPKYGVKGPFYYLYNGYLAYAKYL